MEKLIYLLIIPIVRSLININHYCYLRKVLIKQHKYIDGRLHEDDEKKKRIAQKAGNWVQDNQIEIKKRVLNTGIQDQYESSMEPVGLGYGKQQHLSALDNILFMNTKILESSREIIRRAKGHYKVQALLSFSPLFWIELIIFLPRELFKMAGFETKTKGTQNTINIIQIFYWIVSIIYMIKLITSQCT